MDHPENYMSIRIESYNEPLFIKINESLDKQELRELFSEIIENYILDMKEKKIIDEKRDDLLLVDRNDFSELKKADLDHVIKNKKKIILGFSNLNDIKDKFENLETMTELNQRVLNKDYIDVEKSLSKINSARSKAGDNDILLDIHKNRKSKMGFIPDFGNMSSDRKARAEVARKNLADYNEGDGEKKDLGVGSKGLEDVEEEGEESTEFKNYPKFGDMYVEALEEGAEPNVLSTKLQTHKMSFAYGYSQGFKNCKAPIFIKKEIWREDLPQKMKDIFNGLVTQSNGELKLEDEDIIKSQSGIFGEVISKAFKSIFSSEGMVNMSLPVRIFEPRSTLERITDNFSFVSSYVRRACKAKSDPIERIKNITIATLIGMCCSPSVKKPFNPYLGETFEAEYPCGSKIYLEHTNHNPPISNFLIFTADGVRISGRLTQKAKLGLNSITIWCKGPVEYLFPDGGRVTAYYPQLIQNGVITGSRLLKFLKKVCVIDEKNSLKAYAAIGKKIKSGKFESKRVDTVSGQVYSYNPKKHKEIKNDFSNLYDQFKGKDEIEIKGKIFGILGQAVEWDGVEYFDYNSTLAIRHRPIKHPLPSDCRYREDMIWLKLQDLDQAAIWKLKLEEVQRYDRKLRKEGHKAAGRKVPKH